MYKTPVASCMISWEVELETGCVQILRTVLKSTSQKLEKQSSQLMWAFFTGDLIPKFIDFDNKDILGISDIVYNRQQDISHK